MDSRTAPSQDHIPLKITYLQNPSVEVVNQNATVGRGVKRTY